jgi:hypothetical protein
MISIYTGRRPQNNRRPLPKTAHSRGLRLITYFDIRFRANSRLRSAPSVNPACAAPRGANQARRGAGRKPSK